jgi:hypothetical protein
MPAPAPNAALRTLRTQLAAVLSKFLGDDFRWPVTVRVESRSGELRLEFKPSDDAAPAVDPARPPETRPDPRPDPRHHLTPMSADCLEAADATWRSSADLAQRAGWTYYARWRGAVGRLVQAGYLERQDGTKKLRVTETGRARLREHRAAEAGQE